MSTSRWTERLPTELPELLESLAAPRTPDYADALLDRLATARQRPRWQFAGRWLPAPIARLRAPGGPRGSWRVVALGIVVLVLLAAAVLVVGSRPRVPPPFGPATPGWIGYVANDRLWLAGPDGSNPHAISSGGIDIHPVFSPDGTHLAYVRLAEAGSHANWEEWGSVVVSKADGTNPIILDEDQEGISPFTWSADGSLLVYAKIVAGLDRVVVARSDGSGSATVTNGTAGSWGPSLAPDGRHVAYVQALPTGLRLRIMDLDGRNDRPLTRDPLDRVDVLAWSPDSRTIVYSAGEPSVIGADLWRIDVATGEVSPFAVGRGNQEGPDWSPDGRHVAFVDARSIGQAVIRVSAADGSSTRPISGISTWTFPRWSPDGAHVVATDQAPDGVPALVILDAMGAQPPVRIDLPDTDGVGRGDLPAWQRLAP